MTINIIQPNVNVDDEIPTIIYSGTNFGIPLHFLDEFGNPTTPLSLTYTISNDEGVISTYTPLPTLRNDPITSYVIEISSQDNVITDNLEQRKITVEWTYNRDDSTIGTSIQVFYYVIELQVMEMVETNRTTTIIYGTDVGGDPVPLLVDSEGRIILAPVTAKEYVFKESFDQSVLASGVYTIVSELTQDTMGFGIFNLNATDNLTFTIGGDTVVVPPNMPFYSIFPIATTITFAGTGLSFSAFIEGSNIQSPG